MELARRRQGSYYGVSTPNFKALKASGKLLPLQYYERYDLVASQSGRRTLTWNVNCVPGGCRRTASIATCGIIGDFNLLFGVTDLKDTMMKYDHVMNGLLTEASAKASDSWDAATFFKELPQAISMLTNVGSSIIDLWRRQPQKSGSNAWLQWQMGWKPLYSDLEKIFELLSGDPNVTERTRGKSVYHDLIVKNINSSIVLPNTETHTIKGTDTTIIDISGYVIADILSSNNRVERNPFVSIWEMLPYSFVLDYFFSIGNWIKSMATVPNFIRYNAAVGYRIVREIDVQLTGLTGPGLWSYQAYGSAKIRGELRVRLPRSVSFSPPPFRGLDMQSITRLLNLVALLVQRLK